MGKTLFLRRVLFCAIGVLFTFFSLKGNAQVVGEPIKKSLLPHFVHVQYAGNMGFGSIGAGYRFHKRKMGLALQVGYLPEAIGGVELCTGTIKYFWGPWEIKKKSY